MIIQACIRLIASIVLIYFIYKETGPFTSFFILMVTIRLETSTIKCLYHAILAKLRSVN